MTNETKPTKHPKLKGYTSHLTLWYYSFLEETVCQNVIGVHIFQMVQSNTRFKLEDGRSS